MLSDEMREFLVNGPQGQKKAKALLAFGGAATVRVQWRRIAQPKRLLAQSLRAM